MSVTVIPVCLVTPEQQHTGHEPHAYKVKRDAFSAGTSAGLQHVRIQLHVMMEPVL